LIQEDCYSDVHEDYKTVVGVDFGRRKGRRVGRRWRVSILLVVAAGQGMDTAVVVVVVDSRATEKEHFRLVEMSAGVELRR
jgi:hypothetical protein